MSSELTQPLAAQMRDPLKKETGSLKLLQGLPGIRCCKHN